MAAIPSRRRARQKHEAGMAMFPPITSFETDEMYCGKDDGMDEDQSRTAHTYVAPNLEFDFKVVVPLDDVYSMSDVEEDKPDDKREGWDVTGSPVSWQRDKNEHSRKEGRKSSRDGRHAEQQWGEGYHESEAGPAR